MTKIVIDLPPKPQERPRFARVGNKVRTYERKEMTKYKLQVALKWRQQFKTKHEKGSVSFVMRFYIYPPNYIAKVKKLQQALEDEVIPVDKKPDIDNYVKAILDAVTGIAFKDDGQVASIIANKVYSYNPRTEIEFETMEMKKNEYNRNIRNQ